jgi:hypothetical protein
LKRGRNNKKEIMKHHHTHHTHHKKIKKRGMDNKKLVWIIVIIFILIVISVGIILILKKEEIKPNPIDVQCRFACENAQRTAFCFVEREVNDELTTTCDELSKNSLYAQYNVETCPAISCVVQEEVDQTCVTGLGGTWESPDAEGNCPQSGIKIVRQVTPSDEPLAQGQVCCR